MTMDLTLLHQALLADPVTEAVFKQHRVNPSILQIATLKKSNSKRITLARDNDSLCIEVNPKLLEKVEDPGEISHMIVHAVLDTLVANKEKVLAFSSIEVEKLDKEFLADRKSDLDSLRFWYKKYESNFVEPKAARQHLNKLIRTAQKRKLHVLKFSNEEKQILNMLRKIAVLKKLRLYVVGGCIRDKLLGVENHDLDFMVVTDDLDAYVKAVTNTYDLREPVKLERSQAYTMRIGEIDIDIIDARRVYVPLSRGDQDSLEEDDDWSIALDDIYKRDLTINSIVYDVVNNKLSDPTSRGLKDLSNGVISTIIDPYVKYRINAFDMLRALRFAAVYDFNFAPDMIEAMKENANRIVPRNLGGDISNRRILRELRKAAKTADSWFRMKKFLAETGLINTLLEDVEKVEVQRTSLAGGEEDV